MRGSPPPPKLAQRMLRHALPEDARDDIIGDLDEVYRRTCAEQGGRRARGWYWREACAFSGSFLLERVRDRATGRHAITIQQDNKRGPMRRLFENWAADFRHAGRSLVRAPGFTVVVVGTLALAIGANATIFSVVNAVLLEPLPFPNADRLVHVGGTAPGTDQPEELGVADELYFEYRESVPALEDLSLIHI